MRKLSQRSGWVVIFALTCCCLMSCSPSKSTPREVAETGRPGNGTNVVPSPNTVAPKGTDATGTSPIGRGKKTPDSAAQNVRKPNDVANDSKDAVPKAIGTRQSDSVGQRQSPDEAIPQASDIGRAPSVPSRANQPNTLPSGRANSRSTRPSEPEVSIADLLKVNPSGKEGLGPGDIVPEITGKDMEGQSMRMSDYRGQVVMLDFWGDW